MFYHILPHTLKFSFPAGTSRGVYTERQVWYIFLSEDLLNETICRDIIRKPSLLSSLKVGVGEIAPLYDLSCDYIPNFIEVIDSCCHVFLTEGNTTSLYNYPSIRFGLETALRSLASQDGLTFCNTPFTRGEEGIPINGLVWMGDKETMRQRMKNKLDSGFNCVKLKIGALQIEEELELLRELRHIASENDLQIRVDANGAFTEKNVHQVLNELAKLQIHSIEQPIKQGNWELMTSLCKGSPIPIALDEELIGINTLKGKTDLLQEIRPSYIVLKPTLHGGFEGTTEWIQIAQDLNIGYWVTSALESNIGLNAISQFTSELNTGNFAQGLGTGQLFVKNIPETGLVIEGNKLFRRYPTTS